MRRHLMPCAAQYTVPAVVEPARDDGSIGGHGPPSLPEMPPPSACPPCAEPRKGSAWERHRMESTGLVTGRHRRGTVGLPCHVGPADWVSPAAGSPDRRFVRSGCVPQIAAICTARHRSADVSSPVHVWRTYVRPAPRARLHALRRCANRMQLHGTGPIAPGRAGCGAPAALPGPGSIKNGGSRQALADRGTLRLFFIL
jgi:hypothetical protein